MTWADSQIHGRAKRHSSRSEKEKVLGPDTRKDSKYVHFQVALSSQIEIGFRVKVEPWSSIHQKCAKVTYRFFSWTREEKGMRDSIPKKCRTFSLYSCFLVPFRFPRCLLLWFQADAFTLYIFSVQFLVLYFHFLSLGLIGAHLKLIFSWLVFQSGFFWLRLPEHWLPPVFYVSPCKFPQ